MFGFASHSEIASPPPGQQATGADVQNSTRCLVLGAEILASKLRPLGFRFEIVERGAGNGVRFPIGRLKNGDREIKFQFRQELGGVTYWKHDVRSSHILYMQALGREHTARYPVFGHADEMAGFHCLLEDLEHCDSFLTGDGDAFYDLMKGFKYRVSPEDFFRVNAIG